VLVSATILLAGRDDGDRLVKLIAAHHLQHDDHPILGHVDHGRPRRLPPTVIRFSSRSLPFDGPHGVVARAVEGTLAVAAV
jgi:hypothetical protein